MLKQKIPVKDIIYIYILSDGKNEPKKCNNTLKMSHWKVT